MGAHLIGGKFQSDKYPTCPAGKVPLSTKDPLAQPLLWEYAQGRRAVDAEFSADLETALLHDGYVPEPYLHALRRGTVLRRTRPAESVEVGIVLGPATEERPGVDVLHGWIDGPPDVGRCGVSDEHLRRGAWRIATDTDAATVQALFVEHARLWGPDSAAWVADEPPPGPDAWTSPPLALHWGVPRLRETVAPFDPIEALDRIGRAVCGLTDAQLQGLSASAAKNIVTYLGPAICGELRRSHDHGLARGARVAPTPTIEETRGMAADAIAAAYPDVDGAHLARVRSGEIPALDALAYVLFRGNEAFREEGAEPGADVEAALTALCALRVVEGGGDPADPRERINRARWGALNGGVWIADAHDRTNYLLNEHARLTGLVTSLHAALGHDLEVEQPEAAADHRPAIRRLRDRARTNVQHAAPPPFPPEQCCGQTCAFCEQHDENDVPVGPACGRPATQVLYHRDQRFSPACDAHGLDALDPAARAMVLCVHPPPPADAAHLPPGPATGTAAGPSESADALFADGPTLCSCTQIPPVASDGTCSGCGGVPHPPPTEADLDAMDRRWQLAVTHTGSGHVRNYIADMPRALAEIHRLRALAADETKEPEA